MATPCRAYGCPNVVRSRLQKGYCDEHADRRMGWKKSQEKKGNTTERGYGYVWQRLRLSVLERDGYLCQVCRHNGRLTQATEVDHIVGKANGGDDSLDNLQSLCKPCHKAKTQTESSNAQG